MKTKTKLKENENQNKVVWSSTLIPLRFFIELSACSNVSQSGHDDVSRSTWSGPLIQAWTMN